MVEKPTNELDKLLSNMKPEDLQGYYRENSQHMADDNRAFYYYFTDVVKAKKIKLKDVYSFAGFSQSWGGKLVSMEKHSKERDPIIRLCIAGHFNLEEINRALKLYGMAPLYAKDRRDASLIVSINNRIYDLADIDDILESQGFAKLSVEIE